LPLGFKDFFNAWRQTPKCVASRRAENFFAARGCDSERNSRLGKVMGGRESTTQTGLANSAENTAGVPPTGTIHFTMTSDDKPKLHQQGRFDGVIEGGRHSLGKVQ
jgi:hypothetical protein